MAGYLVSDTRKVTTHRFMEMKQKGEKISMLTSYDYTMAGIVDKAGIDAILVGDSASNVMAGNHRPSVRSRKHLQLRTMRRQASVCRQQ